jgi:hypothetical protein
MSACDPSDRRPGLWLRGEMITPVPDDWTFTDRFKEIYVQVRTPYLLPHSVTIWCAQVDGDLFIGARNPETKNWPDWLDDDRNIRLKIDGKVYDVSAADISSEVTLAAVRAAYAAKYDLPRSAAGTPSANVRYWAVVPRGHGGNG